MKSGAFGKSCLGEGRTTCNGGSCRSWQEQCGALESDWPASESHSLSSCQLCEGGLYAQLLGASVFSSVTWG